VFAGSAPKRSKHRKPLGEKPSGKKVPSPSAEQQLLKIDGRAPPALNTEIIPDQVNCGGAHCDAAGAALFPHPSVARRVLGEVFPSGVACCLQDFAPAAPLSLSRSGWLLTSLSAGSVLLA